MITGPTKKEAPKPRQEAPKPRHETPKPRQEAPKPRQEVPKPRLMTTEKIDSEYEPNENDEYYENK